MVGARMTDAMVWRMELTGAKATAGRFPKSRASACRIATVSRPPDAALPRDLGPVGARSAGPKILGVIDLKGRGGGGAKPSAPPAQGRPGSGRKQEVVIEPAGAAGPLTAAGAAG